MGQKTYGTYCSGIGQLCCRSHGFNFETHKTIISSTEIANIIQPLDQGIITSFKCYYRKELAKKAVTDINAICLSLSSSVSTVAKISKSNGCNA